MQQTPAPVGACQQTSLAQSAGAAGLHCAPSGRPQRLFESHARLSLAHCATVAHWLKHASSVDDEPLAWQAYGSHETAAPAAPTPPAPLQNVAPPRTSRDVQVALETFVDADGMKHAVADEPLHDPPHVGVPAPAHAAPWCGCPLVSVVHVPCLVATSHAWH